MPRKRDDPRHHLPGRVDVTVTLCGRRDVHPWQLGLELQAFEIEPGLYRMEVATKRSVGPSCPDCVRKALACLVPVRSAGSPVTPQNLRQRREAAGLSREELAKLVGVAASTIRNMERGYVRSSSALTTAKLRSLAVLNIPPTDEPKGS